MRKALIEKELRIQSIFESCLASFEAIDIIRAKRRKEAKSLPDSLKTHFPLFPLLWYSKSLKTVFLPRVEFTQPTWGCIANYLHWPGFRHFGSAF